MVQKSVAVVVIGRNEGSRLQRCLQSIPREIPLVYVDSGSTDNSVAFAREIGVTVLSLDMSIGFTAARARNAGWRHIVDRRMGAEFIQFIDGDCVLDATWLETALKSMLVEPNIAAVFGRRRERFPEMSIYNRMCDDEWNVPVGIVAACGGDVLFRTTSLKESGGYSDDLIAGEEPDLCLRLNSLGWLIMRISSEMTLHDANILTFWSWWKRARRSGFAYAAHVLRHGAHSNPEWRRQIRSILFWGFAWPLCGLTFSFFCWLLYPTAGLIFLGGVLGSYVAQILRIAVRKRRPQISWGFAIKYGTLMVTGKFAEFGGAARCWISNYLNREQILIEYKDSL